MFREHDFVKRESIFIPAKEGDEGQNVRRVQEWISLRGQKILVDGKWGPVTSRALFKAVHTALTGGPGEKIAKITPEVWKNTIQAPFFLFTARMHISPVQPDSLDAVWQVLRKATPCGIAEAGGNNMGPWVRAFMRGNQGSNYPWCAGFVSSVLEIAEDADAGFKRPFDYTWSSMQMVDFARKEKKLATWEGLERERPSLCVFAVRGGRTSHQHVGFARAFDYEQGIFETVEGNSNSHASFDGGAVTHGTRGKENKDFILLA